LRILLVWILNAIALYLVTLIVPGVAVQDPLHAFIAAIVLGLVNTLVKPVLIVLTLPITLVTLGLFLLVINALPARLSCRRLLVGSAGRPRLQPVDLGHVGAAA